MVVPVTPRGQETRARILAAAEKVFGEKSYFRVSIADITREAGTGNGTFYLYFPSKEAAFRELVEQRGHEMRTVTHLAMEGAQSRVAAERAAFAAFFDFINQHRSLYRIVRQAEFVDQQLFGEFYQILAEGYRVSLQAAMDRGEVAGMDPEVLAYCLMGVGDFIGMRWVVWQDGGIPPQVFEATLAFVERGLMGREKAERTSTPAGEGGGAAIQADRSGNR